MTLWDEIRRLRRYGVVHCGLVAGQFGGPQDCARFFDLDPNGVLERYDVPRARQVVRWVLLHDLAYGAEVMPPREADRLAEAFVEASLLEEEDSRIYGNIDPEFVTPETPLGAWTSATAATFDTGVLVVARDRCACLWVEDED